MTIVYRISDSGYKKSKPEYINNINCLRNAASVFQYENWHIVADNVKNEDTLSCIRNLDTYLNHPVIHNVSLGSGAQTFNYALDIALSLPEDELIYFVENDYLHIPGSDLLIEEGLDLGADYLAGYDHPDKYLSLEQGGNPEVEGGGELTRVLLSKSTHWKITNSTTMTFATRVKTLKEDEQILREYTKGTYPEDYRMFLALRAKGRVLISSIPGFSTHGENQWLSPLIDWSKI